MQHDTVWEENLRETVWVGRYLIMVLQELKNKTEVRLVYEGLNRGFERDSKGDNQCWIGKTSCDRLCWTCTLKWS